MLVKLNRLRGYWTWTIEAATAEDALAEATRLEALLSQREGGVEQAAKKQGRAAKTEDDPEAALKYAKDKAMHILAKLYSEVASRDDARSVLTQFGVKKFADIPLDRAPELLTLAETIERTYAKESA